MFEFVPHTDFRSAAADVLRRAERATLEALVDPLTGLNNRRAWDTLLATEEARCRRYGHPACVIAIDLDGLKQVNDTHGHAAGDQLLRRAGQALARTCRAEDGLARVGGDEFAILAVETALADGQILLQRIERVLGEAGVQAATGIAARSVTGDMHAAWQAANAAMYAARRAHRALSSGAI